MVATPSTTPGSPATSSPGERGPVRDAVVLNAGIALATASGLAESTPSRAALTAAVREGMDRAEDAIDSGAARELLARWVEVTRSYAG